MNGTLADWRPSSRAAPRRRPPGPGEVLLTLVRREFWEHRALWLAPLVVAALLALCAHRPHPLDVDDARASRAKRSGGAVRRHRSGCSRCRFTSRMSSSELLLLDCLYAERKDRSILFWKSLPVSDGLTVLLEVAGGGWWSCPSGCSRSRS